MTDPRAADSDRLIDLTRLVESEMPTYPGDPAVSIDPHATHERDGYRVSELRLGTHTGTHVDAPAHVDSAGATLDEFDIEDLRFRARVVDCREVGASGSIEPARLPDAAALDALGALIFDTGWADEWGTEQMLRHPFLAPETARRCVERDVAVVTDAVSPDPSDGETDLPAHRALCGAGLPIVENVCHLDTLPEGAFELLVCPLRVDADGAPARVVARV